MLSLGTEFSDLEAPTGEFKNPPCIGYAVKILNVIDEVSKKGNRMLRFEVDIADGEFAGAWERYPKRLYQLYDNEDNLKRLKGIFNTIIAENKAMFPEDDPFASGAFDEQRLVGCIVGTTTKWSDDGYLNLRYFTTVERALKQEEVAKPAAKVIEAEANADGDFF